MDITHLTSSNILVGAQRDELIKWAELFAKSLFCINEGTGTPCGVCEPCIKIDAGSHPDYHVYDAPILKVEDARQMKRTAAIRPSEAENKVFVIEYADNMNAETQNALLKVIEEPQNTFFFLLCQNENALLDTVRSRCAKFVMPNNSQEDMLKKLREENPEIEAIARNTAQAVAEGDELLIYRNMNELGGKKREQMPAFFTLVRVELHALLSKKTSTDKKKIIDVYEYLHRESDNLVVNPGIYGMSIAICASICEILKNK